MCSLPGVAGPRDLFLKKWVSLVRSSGASAVAWCCLSPGQAAVFLREVLLAPVLACVLLPLLPDYCVNKPNPLGLGTLTTRVRSITARVAHHTQLRYFLVR